MKSVPRIVSLPVDLLVTALLWLWFTVGFICFFMPLYVVAFALPWRRAAHIQWLNSVFWAVFFGLLRGLAPRVRWRVSPEVRQLHSAVVICNHQSYFDSIYLVSLFRRQATIVKPVFFRVPIFGWLLDAAGYLAPTADPSAGGRMLGRVKRVAALLGDGGVLFVFPEGTRSRDGTLGPFKTGAFKLARLLEAPIELVAIRNTGRVFVPGHPLVHTCERRTVTLEHIERLDVETVKATRPADLAERARETLVAALGPGSTGSGSTQASGDAEGARDPHQP